MKLRSGIGLGVLAMLAAGVVGHAGAQTQAAFYGMATGTRLSGVNVGTGTALGATGNFTGYGAMGGFYTQWIHTKGVTVGADFRYGFARNTVASGYTQSLLDGSAGARAEFQLLGGEVRPYVQGGGMIAGTNYGQFQGKSDGPGFSLQGGVDVKVLSHVDVRAEYSYGEVFNVNSQAGHGSLTLNQVGVGAVYRFSSFTITKSKGGKKKK